MTVVYLFLIYCARAGEEAGTSCCVCSLQRSLPRANEGGGGESGSAGEGCVSDVLQYVGSGLSGGWAEVCLVGAVFVFV